MTFLEGRGPRNNRIDFGRPIFGSDSGFLDSDHRYPEILKDFFISIVSDFYTPCPEKTAPLNMSK